MLTFVKVQLHPSVSGRHATEQKDDETYIADVQCCDALDVLKPCSLNELVKFYPDYISFCWWLCLLTPLINKESWEAYMCCVYERIRACSCGVSYSSKKSCEHFCVTLTARWLINEPILNCVFRIQDSIQVLQLNLWKIPTITKFDRNKIVFLDLSGP